MSNLEALYGGLEFGFGLWSREVEDWGQPVAGVGGVAVEAGKDIEGVGGGHVVVLECG